MIRENLKVFYFSTLHFPDGGMAAGNRILHLAKALRNVGVEVEVLSPFSDSGRKECMTIDGVQYQSLCERYRGWVGLRFAFYVLFPIRFAHELNKATNREKVVYCYGECTPLMIVAYVISRIYRCRLCMEGAEFPRSVYLGRSRLLRWIDEMRLKLFDGVVAISEELRLYYRSKCRRTCKVIHVPMTVDYAMFANESRKSPLDFDYILYAGSMNRIGGGVDVLVKSFNILAQVNKTIHLVLMGNGTDSDKSDLLALVSPKVVDRLHFLFGGRGGRIARRDVPMYVKNAKILAMLPLQTKQQEGCFPTKLGEYLASGVPSVVSRVGLPRKVLRDGENVRFVDENNAAQTASVFSEIINDYAKALTVASCGQRFAKENFDYAGRGQKLLEWYKGLFI